MLLRWQEMNSKEAYCCWLGLVFLRLYIELCYWKPIVVGTAYCPQKKTLPRKISNSLQTREAGDGQNAAHTSWSGNWQVN
jgi:hypothetical protein